MTLALLGGEPIRTKAFPPSITVRELDGKCGDQAIQFFCNSLRISDLDFWNHANGFRGDMWEQTADGRYELKNPIWKQEPIRGKYSVRNIMNRLGI